jgi:transcriptional regulator with XRE-family HTH domain
VKRTFGENLRRVRKAANLSARELAKRVGVTPPVVSKWETHKGLPEGPTLLKLAKALNVSIDELLAGVDPEYDLVREDRAQYGAAGDDDGAAQSRRAIPILFEGEAPAGGLSWTDEGTPLFQVDEWGSRPSDIRDPRAYLVVIRGDAMEPMIKAGMRAVISPNQTVADGDLACVHLRSGERLVRVVQHDRAQHGWLLEGYNPSSRARFVPEADVATIHKVAYVRTLT